MQRNSSSFEQGDIIVADLLYSEQVGVKRRPVLVISKGEYNKNSEDLIVLKITSAEKQTKFDVPLKQAELEAGSLRVESIIMVDFISTVQKSLVSEKIGRISEKKLEEVKKRMKELYAL
ncbi:MAG: type II toxin-antitoxin system PemK/MazF family toxin [archaeon]